MIRRPPRSTHCISSAASDVYKRQQQDQGFTDLRDSFYDTFSKLIQQRMQTQFKNYEEFEKSLTRSIISYLIAQHTQKNGLEKIFTVEDKKKNSQESKETTFSLIKQRIKQEFFYKLSQRSTEIKEFLIAYQNFLTLLNQIYPRITMEFSDPLESSANCYINFFLLINYKEPVIEQSQKIRVEEEKKMEEIDENDILQLPQLQKLHTRTESTQNQVTNDIDFQQQKQDNNQQHIKYDKHEISLEIVNIIEEILNEKKIKKQVSKFFEKVLEGKNLIQQANIKAQLIKHKVISIKNKQDELLEQKLNENKNSQPNLKLYYQLKDKLEKYQVEIKVDRNNLFESSIQQLLLYGSHSISVRRFSVQYLNEEGIDGGGLLSEWFSIVFQKVLQPEFGLFTYSSNGITCQPSITSSLVPNHLLYFQFIGVIAAESILKNKVCGLKLTKNFLKHLIGKPLCVNDLEDIEPQVCKNLMKLLEEDITNVDLGLNFVYNTSILGKEIDVELVPNGKNIFVNEQNKKQYVKAIANWIMIDSIQEQIANFLDGFFSIIPQDLVSQFTVSEIAFLLVGQVKINLEEMKQYTMIYYPEKLEYLKQWFWEIVEEFTPQELQQLLFFTTGSMQPPVGGFKDFKLQFHFNTQQNKYSLPVSHTCSQMLDIPVYESKSQLESKLKQAMYEGVGGFFIA
eukprot:TRINITY_DN13954_c0_g1_i1.p1 TRINITY_DN13954_c0_g1~~TRINITY_DN13954_c0_g1_i1.p1  ORF type:complete len:681 (+),score=123.89 TRINITY_DN13954_c0_g1_i1:90-2132(+)